MDWKVTLDLLVSYGLRIWPAAIPIALFFLIVRPPAFGRVVVYLLIFIVLRDAMTPEGLWRFGSEGWFWIRMDAPPLFLILFGSGAAFMMLLTYSLDRENRPDFRFFSNDRVAGFLVGLSGAILVTAPLFFRYRLMDITLRGGPVPVALLPSLAIFAFLGNFAEEGLFRGYLLSALKEYQRPVPAAIGSGIIFSLCHIFLAMTVTSVGLSLILFTLWEGIIAGLVGSRYGVIPATLTHGGAIFLLSSGLF